MVKNIITFVSCLLFLFLLTNQNLLSQYYIDQIFPSSGAVNIGKKPIIKLITNHKIDTSQFYSNTPYHIVGDTANYTIYQSNIIIIPTYFINEPDSLYPIFGLYGHCVITGEDTISLILDWELSFEKSYSIIVKNLKLMIPDTSSPPNYDIITVDTVITPAFTTANLPISFISSSINENPIITPFDDITINFSKKLNDCNTASGSIVSIYKDTILKQINCQLSEDSTSIIVTPVDSFDIGEEYNLRIDLAKLTGDSIDNVQFPFRIKNSSTILVKIKSQDSTVTLPDSLIPICGDYEWVINYRESSTISVPKIYDDYYFVNYTCSNDTSINNKNSCDINLTINSNNLEDKIIYAEYAKIPRDTISFDNGNSTSNLYIMGFEDSLGENKYTFSRKENNFLYVHAIPNNGYTFSHWESSDSNINNRTTQFLMIPSQGPDVPIAIGRTIGNGNIDPIYTQQQWHDCSTSTFCVDIQYILNSDQDPNLNPDNVIDLIGECKIDGISVMLQLQNYPNEERRAWVCKPFYSTHLPIPPKSIYIKLKDMYSNCYEIDYYLDELHYIRRGTIIGENPIGSSFTDYLTVPSPHYSCKNTLYVKIQKKFFELIVEEKVKNNRILPSEKYVKTSVLNSENRKLLPNNWGRQFETLSDGKRVLKQLSKYYRIECGKTITLVPNGYYGYYPGEWSCETGYTCTTIINPHSSPPLHAQNGENKLQITMNGNKKVKHLFDYGFRIEYVSFYKSNHDGTFEKFRVDEKDGNNPYPILNKNAGFINAKNVDYGAGLSFPLDNIQIEHSQYHKHTAVIRFHFNKEVDESTLEMAPNTRYFNANLYVYDENTNGRKDRNPNNPDHGYENMAYTYSKTTGELGANNKTGHLIDNGYTAEMLMLTNGMEADYGNAGQTILAITHFNQFCVVLKNGIKSLDEQELLENPIEFERITSLPGIYINNKVLGNKLNTGTGNSELVAHIISLYCDFDKILDEGLISEDEMGRSLYGFCGLKLPENGSHNFNNDPNNEWNVTGRILKIPRLLLGHRIEIGYNMVDMWLGCSDNQNCFNEKVNYVSQEMTNKFINKITPTNEYHMVGWEIDKIMKIDFLGDLIFMWTNVYIKYGLIGNMSNYTSNLSGLWAADFLYSPEEYRLIGADVCAPGMSGCSDHNWTIEIIVGEIDDL